jgi:hypothetical protein
VSLQKCGKKGNLLMSWEFVERTKYHLSKETKERDEEQEEEEEASGRTIRGRGRRKGN